MLDATMTNLIWVEKEFEKLSSTELYEILKLRMEVFMLEQNCLYQELDDKDQSVDHIMGYIGDELVAYARILGPGISYAEASIGRIIAKKELRGKGVGHELITKCIKRIEGKYKTSKIRISAQEYLIEYYKTFGFRCSGEIYLEDLLPHIEMYRE